MKIIFNPKILLSLIILLAAFLRFYQISTTAPTLNWDEAALGYNAYTLGIDGKDEFGNFLPIQYLESFGDYKPIMYSYAAVIPVKIFGLNEFSVRFPSALLGTLTVLLTYLLVKELFPKISKRRDQLALLSAFILAISPWHIMLSRGAFEANISTFFIVLGVIAFLKAINRNSWYLVLSAISFALTFYTFNTSRVFIPIFVIVLAIIFRNTLIKNYKASISAFLIGLILILPIFPFLISPQAKLRYEEVNIFSDLSIIENSNQYIENDGNAPWSKMLHNRRVLYSIEFLDHYFDNLNPKFLFIEGDGNPRFSTQDVGQTYIIYLPFLILGIFYLIRRKEGYYYIIPIWILLGIIPAATARETPHALRIETIIPTLQILTAYGVLVAVDFFKKKKYQQIFLFSFIILALISLIYFYHGLIYHYPREYSAEWQEPYKESVKYVESVKDDYKKVIFTKNLGRPYIYFLTYGDNNPDLLRKNSDIEREVFGFVHVNRLGDVYFKDNISDLTLEEDVLYLSIPEKMPENVKIIKTFILLNGEEALIAFEKE